MAITEERIEKIRSVLSVRQPTLTVVFENVHDPHNVSAVIRSCDAVGIVKAHGVYSGYERFPELGSKTSGSAWKWVDVVLHHTIEECYSVLRSEGKRIYTTHMESNSSSLFELDLTQPVALVFGSEHDGVSEQAVRLADGNFTIPQVGMVQSLNISVACAVSLYEAYRQRSVAGLYDEPQIPNNELQERLADWIKR
ncbi:MAG: RNA methyltransferase [Ignavibacteria bacterium]|nr:RNA methyltransferase [Ignavibacteria bacterium]